MISSRHFFSLFSLFLVLFLGSACARNTLTSSWVDQSYHGPVKGRILVIGIFEDPVTHKIFEDSFADRLVQSGADAVPSHKYGKGAERHSEEWLRQVIEQSGAATVLLTHLNHEDKETYDFKSHGVILGGVIYGNTVNGYHSYIVKKTLVPGYTATKKTYFIDVVLFDSHSNKPIWSSKSKSVNLDPFLRKDDEQIENLYIKDMKHYGLL